MAAPDPAAGSASVPIDGFCSPGFEAVRAAFEANFADGEEEGAGRGELGSAVTVMVGGETVVDLWGGYADQASTRPWQADTLVNSYSVGKGVVSVLLLELVDEGRVDLDEPIATYWPDFAADGKGAATVRHALSHQAGVPAIRERLTNDDLWDWDHMCAAVAATAPWWPPGTRHAYHTNTFGHLVGGIITHVTGERPGARLQALLTRLDQHYGPSPSTPSAGPVAPPAGPVAPPANGPANLPADLYFGLPDHLHARCAEVDFDSPNQLSAELLDADLDDELLMQVLGYINPPGYSSIGVVNTAEWRRAEVPSTNGHMTARGVARFYRALLDGAILSPDLLAEAVRTQAEGWCPVLGQDVAFGLGLQPWTEHRPFGRNPGGYGHYGSGGSLGFADPTASVAFGYVMNHVIPRWQNPRNRALVDAVYSCL